MAGPTVAIIFVLWNFTDKLSTPSLYYKLHMFMVTVIKDKIITSLVLLVALGVWSYPSSAKHAQPIHCGQLLSDLETLRTPLVDLLNISIDFKENEVVRYRLDGHMQVGVVHTIHEDTIDIALPGSPLLLPIPTHHVFKLITQGEGDIIVPGKLFVPKREAFMYGTDLTPAFDFLGKTDGRIASNITAEGFFNGAAKLSSLPHFLNQKADYQLELLLRYYRVFIGTFFTPSSTVHIVVLGTLLVEAGFSTRVMLSLTPGEKSSVQFEVTIHTTDTAQKKVYTVDPSKDMITPL